MPFIGEPNFTEKQVEFAIQAVLMASFPWKGPILLRIPDEQKTGADAYFKHVYPLFMQFKRSSWINLGYTGRLPILKDRSHLKVTGTKRALFFKLHRLAKHAIDYQHNILLTLDNQLRTRRPGITQGRAVYVAPLEIRRSVYLRGVIRACVKCFVQSAVTFLPQVPIFNKKNINIMGLSFGSIPFIERHVCFPPTTTVTTSRHYYSYSVTGKDIVFHSPTCEFDGPRKLGPWLDSHFANMESEENFLSRDELDEIFNALLNSHENTDYMTDLNANHTELSPIAKCSRLLREVYEIETFLFFAR